MEVGWTYEGSYGYDEREGQAPRAVRAKSWDEFVRLKELIVEVPGTCCGSKVKQLILPLYRFDFWAYVDGVIQIIFFVALFLLHCCI